MDTAVKKISSIARLHYKVIVFCPRCATRKLVDLKDYPGFTLEDIHLHMHCPHCGAQGMDFSIVRKDNS